MLYFQARQLENQIDVKLVSFSKLGSSHASSSHSHKASLLGSHNSEESFSSESKTELASGHRGPLRESPSSEFDTDPHWGSRGPLRATLWPATLFVCFFVSVHARLP